MRKIEKHEIDAVSGGTSILPLPNSYSDFWNEELLKYKMGLPNLFGVNPDSTLPQPPFGA